MRTALGALSLLIAAPACAQTMGPAAPAAAVERNKASWAEMEAERLATDGDYDGAAAAQAQADNARHMAERLEADAKAPEHAQRAK